METLKHALKQTNLTRAIGAVLVIGLGGAAHAASAASDLDKTGYAVSSSGHVVHTVTGECVHTSSWTPGKSIPGCDGYQEPVAAVQEEPAPVETDIAAVEREPMRYTLDARTLFDFDKAELRPESKQQLDAIAGRISRDAKVSRVNVTGYTDRLGPDEYNMRLSQQRATAVSEYLRQRAGIEQGKFEVQGAGESHSVTSCDGVKGEGALIECLQPDRRVEVTIEVEEMDKVDG